MELIYNWNFNPLESYPTASGQTDVVFLVHWQLNATTESYTARQIGAQPIVQYTSESVFIPFNELTFETVYGWVTSSMGEETYNSITASLIQNIENQINPPILTQQAPWLTTSTTTTTTTIEEITTSTTTTTTTIE
jgi:hypothetical protein